jgi:hypothetical protein
VSVCAARGASLSFGLCANAAGVALNRSVNATTSFFEVTIQSPFLSDLQRKQAVMLSVPSQHICDARRERVTDFLIDRFQSHAVFIAHRGPYGASNERL